VPRDLTISARASDRSPLWLHLSAVALGLPGALDWWPRPRATMT